MERQTVEILQDMADMVVRNRNTLLYLHIIMATVDLRQTWAQDRHLHKINVAQILQDKITQMQMVFLNRSHKGMPRIRNPIIQTATHLVAEIETILIHMTIDTRITKKIMVTHIHQQMTNTIILLTR